MIRIAVDWNNFAGKPGVLANQQILSEYSVGADHTVINDRSNARYLIEDNIRDGLNVDLKNGFCSAGTYLEKKNLENTVRHWEEVPSLQSISRWAVNHDGATFKEVFGDADFAGSRNIFRRVASTFRDTHANWTLTAQNFGGVILLREGSLKIYGAYESEQLGTYSKLKFTQYMTTNNPNGRPDPDSPVDNRPAFEIVVRSDLEVGGETFKLCCSGEIDALSGDEPIEIKAAKKPLLNHRSIVLSEILGLRRIVVGLKDEEHILSKVVEMNLEDFKNVGNMRMWISLGYSFLFTVLSEIKKFLTYNDACKCSYDQYQKIVHIKSISREQAKADFGKEKGENGEFITDKLMEHFNL